MNTILFLDKDPVRAASLIPDNYLNASLKSALSILATCVRVKTGKEGELMQEFKTPLGKSEMVAPYPYKLDEESSEDPIIDLVSDMDKPHTAWVRYSKANFNWLVKHAKAIIAELQNRESDKEKQTAIANKLEPALGSIKTIEQLYKKCEFDWTGLTPPPLPAKGLCKNDDIFNAYRQSLHYRNCKWSNGAPNFWNADLAKSLAPNKKEKNETK